MELKIYSFGHSSHNEGLALRIIPETDEEDQLLIALFKNGRLELGHSGRRIGAHSYNIKWGFGGEEDKISE